MKLKDFYILIIIFNIFYWSNYFEIFGNLSSTSYDDVDEPYKLDKSNLEQIIDPFCVNFTGLSTSTSLPKKKIDPKIVEFKNNPENLCTESNPVLFVYIFNKAHSFDKRKVIRRTWANKALFPTVRFAFILGLSKDESVNIKITKESELNRDIIQGTFVV